MLPMGTHESIGNIFSIFFIFKNSLNNSGLHESANILSSFIDLNRI